MNPTAQATAELYASAAWASAEPVQRNTQIIQQAWEMGSKTAAQLTQQSVLFELSGNGVSSDRSIASRPV